MNKKLEQPFRMINSIKRMLRTFSDEDFSKFYEGYIKSGNEIVLQELGRRMKLIQLKNEYQRLQEEELQTKIELEQLKNNNQ